MNNSHHITNELQMKYLLH